MKIGVKNFRAFDEMSEFEIRPLTILVGPNNSGKSSFTKLLMLLKNGYQKLNFKILGDHKLDSYQNALNRNTGCEEIDLQFSVKSCIVNNEMFCNITYFENGIIKKFSIFDGLISFEADEEVLDGPDRELYLSNDMINYRFKIQIQEVIFFFKNILYEELLNENRKWKIDLFNIEAVTKGVAEFITLTERHPSSNHKIENIPTWYILSRLGVIYHKLSEFETPYLLYDLFIDDEKVTNQYKEKIIDIQNNLFLNDMSLFDLAFSGFKVPNSLHQQFDNWHLTQQLKSVFENELKGQYKNSVEIKHSVLGELLFKETLFTLSHYNDGATETEHLSFIESLFLNMFDDIDQMRWLSFLSADRGQQQRVYQKNDYSFNMLQKQHKKDFKENKKHLFDEILEILNIKGKIVIKSFENVLSVYIKNGNSEENLADLGLGFSQLIPLILFLDFGENYITKFPIIIEEPEANLHPALQSKLADLFVKINEYFPNLILIIETHSEYFIRKLQYLVASKQAKSENCIINYFNSNDNVNKNEPKVKAIKILDDGSLSDHFGTGFFDEVSLLQVQMRKILKENAN